MALTRHCRALDCPRRVASSVLFCDVHWRQLPPRYTQPIYRNRDTPSRATINDSVAVISGTRAAIAYLARKEVKAADLKLAASVQQPPTGRITDGSPTSGSGTGSTDRSTSDTSGGTGVTIRQGTNSSQ